MPQPSIVVIIKMSIHDLSIDDKNNYELNNSN